MKGKEKNVYSKDLLGRADQALSVCGVGQESGQAFASGADECRYSKLVRRSRVYRWQTSPSVFVITIRRWDGLQCKQILLQLLELFRGDAFSS
jgi:hypothetical protein